MIVTSDNGAPDDVGGTPTEFFESDGALRGQKGTLYEGGIRVPMIARWPGRIPAGATSDHIGANWDMWATFAELIGAEAPDGTDGISIAPTLLGRSSQRTHDALYWEFHSQGSSQAVRMGRWKGIRNNILTRPDAALELYDLDRDLAEATNLAGDHPEIVRRIEEIMKSVHTRVVLPTWNFTRSSAQ